MREENLKIILTMKTLKVLLYFSSFLSIVMAQISWTPIFVDGNSQVDLWTHEAKGCRCSFDSKRQDCACCAKDGGCPCGRDSPHRCTQCGLEDYCSNLCNVTLDSRVLSARSGKTFGQLKSPSIEGPSMCYYTLQPMPGQRIELQVYRLVSAGHFNGSSCQGGFLQLVDGAAPLPSRKEVQICGENGRYAPPIVLFADNGPATLIFQITEETVRSQFLAYFSFTSVTSSQGIQYKGGRRIENTECDWLYQDYACRAPGSCVLATPGYPGLYPPHRHCKYHIAISSIQTKVKISFNSLLLPQNQCTTDYIAIYQGTLSSNSLLTKLCGNRKEELTYSGPNLFLEFSSGPPVPPYDYNGFKATLEFSEKPTSTESSINFMLKTTETGVLMDGTSAPRPAIVKSSCDMYFSGTVTRSGTFDTRSRSWSSACTFTFVGRATDIVHVSLFNYILRSTSCQSAIEIYDGLVEDGIKPIQKICSPVTKRARDNSTARFIEQQTFVSTENTLSILLKRTFPSPFQADMEFLDGAYLFHDEHVDGTLKPSTLCDVDYYGLSSASHGQVTNPGTQDLYFNIQRHLKCVQRFIPAANQSITLTVSSYQKSQPDPNCHTQCGDFDCRCVTSLKPLAQVDHLLFQTESGQTLTCLCGDFLNEWLPVTIQSWSPIKLVYSVAHYSWETKGFNFTANYTFVTDGICGHHTLTSPDGEIKSIRIIPDGQLNYFYHQRCTWLLDTKVERQLNLELYTAQNHNCHAWNVTIHHYDESSSDRAGQIIETFCPRHRQKKYELPWKTDLVVIKLQATTQKPPEFTLRWRSQVFRSNNRIADPSPAPGSATPLRTIFPCIFLLITYILARFVHS